MPFSRTLLRCIGIHCLSTANAISLGCAASQSKSCEPPSYGRRQRSQCCAEAATSSRSASKRNRGRGMGGMSSPILERPSGLANRPLSCVRLGSDLRSERIPSSRARTPQECSVITRPPRSRPPRRARSLSPPCPVGPLCREKAGRKEHCFRSVWKS
jgi:hypothetical protein